MKRIVRFKTARIDCLSGIKPGAVVRYHGHNERGYIPDILKATFNDDGTLSRMVTKKTIYVQVKE